ncbi:MAG TPA: N-acetylmuramoyl-L-alanine amidase [Rhodothermales bacterium]|nr:N-acetylmuramoyl-L-alanine amidase [Rhodothermales bacterium]
MRRAFGVAIVALLLAGPLRAQVLTGVTCAPEGERTVCQFEAATPMAVPALHAREGLRTFGLHGVTLAPGFGAPVLAAPVTAVRTRRSGDTLRVEVEVEGAPETTFETDPRGLRLVLRPAPSAVATPSDPADVPLPFGFDAGRWALDHIVVDAGHGGHDIGASYFGVREKDVTLAVARRLGRLLETELGVRVTYTRTGDTFIPLAQRGHLANAAGGKLFISLHANSMPGGARARGTETYFLGLHRTDAARTVMERENSVVSLEEDTTAYAAFDDELAVVQTLAGSAYLRTSERFAALVEQQLGRQAGRTSRGVKQAGFYVLWSASMPAVLVEMGFLTDPAEARFLASAQGQEAVARAVLEAVRALKVQYDRALR